MNKPSSTRNMLWFTVAMAVALICYAVARNQLWNNASSCHTVEKHRDLEGEIFLLNRKLRECKGQQGLDSDSSYSKKLFECETVERDLYLKKQKLEASISATCDGSKCKEELGKC